MILIQETSLRIPAIVGALVVVAAIVAISLSSRLHLSRSARSLYAFATLILVFCIFLIVVPTRRAREQLCHTLRSRWFRFHDSNILNFHYALMQRNRDISPPLDSRGSIITDTIATDLHLELNASGFISISNYLLTQSKLSYLLSARMRKFGAYRVFIWSDAKAPLESLDDLIRILQDEECTPLYIVVSTVSPLNGKAIFRAVPWEDFLNEKGK